MTYNWLFILYLTNRSTEASYSHDQMMFKICFCFTSHSSAIECLTLYPNSIMYDSITIFSSEGISPDQIRLSQALSQA